MVALLAGTGCSRPRPAGPWVDGELREARVSGRFEVARLRESSGVAVSRSQPGVLWTHDDSGNPAELFATDTAGRPLGWWSVLGATNADWEDIALGPCPSGACLYIGETGDNREDRPGVRLYRVPEPRVGDSTGSTAPAEALAVRYPDRPRDVEALFVDGTGDTWLVSKGRSDGVFLYRIPAAAWGADSAVADLISTLPIPAGRSSSDLVTGAAISPDGRTVVVRTYSGLHFFHWDADRRLVPAPGPNRCDIGSLEEPQGEAVDWLDAHTLVLTSEDGGRLKGPIHLLKCASGFSRP